MTELDLALIRAWKARLLGIAAYDRMQYNWRAPRLSDGSYADEH